MSRLIKLGFERDEFGYELELNWDDEAFAETATIAFEIAASRHYLNDATATKLEVLSVSVSIEPTKNEPPFLIIRAGGEEVVKVSLEPILNESQILDMIPASAYSLIFGGDPITGCLIRSGLSTTIGQIIECKNETAGGLKWFRPRMSAIGHCLREHVPAMGARMASRALKCVFTFGIA